MTGEVDIIVLILFWDWRASKRLSNKTKFTQQNVFWKIRRCKQGNNWPHKFLPVLQILCCVVMLKTFVIIMFDCASCCWKCFLIYIKKIPFLKSWDTTHSLRKWVYSVWTCSWVSLLAFLLVLLLYFHQNTDVEEFCLCLYIYLYRL